MPIKKNNNYEIYLGGYNMSKRRVKYINLSDSSLILYAGDEYTLEYSISPKNAIYEEVEWLSRDESIATVDENGHIKAIKQGSTIITVRIDKVIARCSVMVKEVIHFADPIVKQVMVRNYDIDGDGEISYYEASKVTSIPFPLFTGMPITEFSELQYFNNLKTIGQHAFDSCKNLTYIVFPNSLEKINKNAFSYCNSLTEITITPNVSSIGSEAFSDCENLKTAYVNRDVPPTNGNKILDRCPSLEHIVVPSEYIDDYLNSVGWGMEDDDTRLYYTYILRQCFDYTFNFFLS